VSRFCIEICYKSANCSRETCGLFVCLTRLVIHDARLGSRSSAPGKSLDRKFVSQCEYLDCELRTLQIQSRATWLRLGLLAVCCAFVGFNTSRGTTYLGALKGRNLKIQLFQEQIELVVDDIIIMVSDSRAMGRQQPRYSWESDHEESLSLNVEAMLILLATIVIGFCACSGCNE
jgi:hypothetical protein